MSVIPFHAIDVSFGTEDLFFSVTVQRKYTDIAVDDPATEYVDESTDTILRTDLAVPQTSSTTPAAAYSALGVRNLSITGLLLAADHQCKNMADYLLDRYSTPQVRIRAMTVILDGLSTAVRATVAALDITDVISLTWKPAGTGSIVSLALLIEGVAYQSTVDGVSSVTFNTSEAITDQWFTLDDATLGALDGAYKLAY